MKPLKVVLVQPPIEDFYLTKKRTLPYGLAAIAACVRDKGFDVEILDGLATGKSKKIDYPEEFSYLKPFYGQKDVSFFSLFHEFRHFGYSFEHMGAAIRKKQPFVVGISSLFTAYSNEAIKTALAIKQFYPPCKIVIGGHHPTIFPEKVLACPAVDFVLRGEGETSMAKLCDALQQGSDLSQVPGIAFKKATGVYISEPSWITDFDPLPLPALDLINHEFYQRKKKSATMVVSSRGCPMQCSYCSVSATSSYAPFRQRKVKDVIREITVQANDHDIGFIDFEDENLCFNKPWFMDLFTEIKKVFTGKSIELRAMNGLFPSALDEEIVSLMASAGFKTLNLSVGSTSKDQLEKFKRRDIRASFEKALMLAKTHGLDCVSYIIAAAPGQTAESSLKDLVYLAQKRTLVGLSIYYPAPGSLDYQKCDDLHILPSDFSLMRATALPLNDTTTRLEAVTLLRLSRILNFLKHLMDTRGAIPEPAVFSHESKLLLTDRSALSEKLLQWFLADGIIRGVDAEGRIYSHGIEKKLTLKFIEQITPLRIRGVK